MTWIGRVLAFLRAIGRPPEHDRITRRADAVIAEAFRHADRIFYPRPDRRRHPR